MYHHILPKDGFIASSIDNFDKQMKFLNENNYKTYWFSMQIEHNQNVLMSMLNYADVKKDRADYKIKYDHMLLEDLKKVDFSKKSFTRTSFFTV